MVPVCKTTNADVTLCRLIGWSSLSIYCHCAHLTRGPNARTNGALREHGSCLVGQDRCCSSRAWFLPGRPGQMCSSAAWFLPGKLRQMLLSAFLVYDYQYSYTCYPYHSLSSSSSICFLCFSISLPVQVLTVSLLLADQKETKTSLPVWHFLYNFSILGLICIFGFSCN